MRHQRDLSLIDINVFYLKRLKTTNVEIMQQVLLTEAG